MVPPAPLAIRQFRLRSAYGRRPVRQLLTPDRTAPRALGVNLPRPLTLALPVERPTPRSRLPCCPSECISLLPLSQLSLGQFTPHVGRSGTCSSNSKSTI